MALLTVADAYAAAGRVTQQTRKNEAAIIEDFQKSASVKTTFDVFLSHSSTDRTFIIGARQLLVEQGLSVYVDWIDDRQLDRSNVTTQTAAVLRKRMQQSSSFLYATSTNSVNSKWMPWEIGYYDGFRRDRIAIFPLLPAGQSAFVGQEYLGLYPYIERVTDISTAKNKIGKAEPGNRYIPIESFAKGLREVRTGYR